jgi:tol-pal system protein YbgF
MRNKNKKEQSQDHNMLSSLRILLKAGRPGYAKGYAAARAIQRLSCKTQMKLAKIMDCFVGTSSLRAMRGKLIILCIWLLASTSLRAQDNGQLVVDLINRVGTIEDENRELRGQLEEVRHQMDQLTKKMETLSADVDYRLSSPESGGGTPLSPSTPAPMETETPSSGGSSSAKVDYEKARSFLEQGDYLAAEHAFAAFVSSYAKDDLAGAAQYWLGVTFFVRGDYEKASAAFAKGYKQYPKSNKAPDMLLKLAKSLDAQNRKADACATLDQLSSQYPKAHTKDVASEKKKLKCK